MNKPIDLVAGLKRIAREFDGVAQETILKENLGKHVFELKQIMDLAKNGKKILDVGGGMGVNLLVLSELDQGWDLYLIDRFEEYAGNESRMGSAEKGRAIMDKHGIKVTKQGFFSSKMPFPDRTFDLVTCFDVIEHLPSLPLNLLHEIKRVLKPEGSLILGVPNSLSLTKMVKLIIGRHPYMPWPEWISGSYFGHYREYSSKECSELLRQAGFRDIKVQAISEPTLTRVWSGKSLFSIFSLFLEWFFSRLRPSLYAYAKN